MYLNGALINNNDLPDTLAIFFNKEVANIVASVQVVQGLSSNECIALNV